MTTTARADGGQEDLRAEVVAGGDAPPVVEPVGYDLDAVAPLLVGLVGTASLAT